MLSSRLPAYILIALCLFVCGLTAHFLAENVAPIFELIATEAIEADGDSDIVYEDAEDDFVLPVSNTLHLNVVTNLFQQAILKLSSVAFSPLLPPPDFI